MKIQLSHDILCFTPEDGHDQNDLNNLDRWCECAIHRDECGAPHVASISVNRLKPGELSSDRDAARTSYDIGTPPMRLRVYERGEISLIPRTMREHELCNMLARVIQCTRTANALTICGLNKKHTPEGKLAVWIASPEVCVKRGQKPILGGIDATGGVIRCVANGRRHAADMLNSIGGNVSANQIREYWEQKYDEARLPDLETGVWLHRSGKQMKLA